MILVIFMSITIHSDSKYKQYENLLLEKDQIQKEANQYQGLYLHHFGEKIVTLYRLKVECIRLKKKISLFQFQINQNQGIDIHKINYILKHEMTSYNNYLEQLLNDVKNCKKLKYSSDYEIKRSKQLYRRLAKQIHPDVNPLTDKTPELMDLWNQITIAYQANDTKELSELDVLVQRILQDLHCYARSIDIPNIDEIILQLKEEIQEYVQNEPYTYKFIVMDEDKIYQKDIELKKEIQSYKDYQNKLNDVISKLLEDQEVFQTCQMN